MFRLNDTDKEWQKWGEHDPYFAVVSREKYKGGRNKRDFFAVGEQYFKELLAQFDRISLPLNNKGSALDYGCGVGRILKPISHYFKYSVGIDISHAMLDEAKKHINLNKAELRLFDGKNLSHCLSDDTFHFIHTSDVFQHIRPKRGIRILEQLLERLDTNGKALIHVPIFTHNKIKHLLNQGRSSHPILFRLSSRFILQKKHSQPIMQLNIYPSDILIHLFDKLGIEVRYISVRHHMPVKNYTYASWHLYKA